MYDILHECRLQIPGRGVPPARGVPERARYTAPGRTQHTTVGRVRATGSTRPGSAQEGCAQQGSERQQFTRHRLRSMQHRLCVHETAPPRPRPARAHVRAHPAPMSATTQGGGDPSDADQEGQDNRGQVEDRTRIHEDEDRGGGAGTTAMDTTAATATDTTAAVMAAANSKMWWPRRRPLPRWRPQRTHTLERKAQARG